MKISMAVRFNRSGMCDAPVWRTDRQKADERTDGRQQRLRASLGDHSNRQAATSAAAAAGSRLAVESDLKRDRRLTSWL